MVAATRGHRATASRRAATAGVGVDAGGGAVPAREPFERRPPPGLGAAVAGEQVGGDPVQPRARGRGPGAVVGRPPLEGHAERLAHQPVGRVVWTMTTRVELAERLAAAGFAAADADSRAAMVDDAARAFGTVDRASGRSGPGSCRAASRVFGKHTDYAGGRSLVAAVPRGFASSPAARGWPCRLIDARWQAAMDVDPDDRTRGRSTGWANYVAVVARRWRANFPGAALAPTSRSERPAARRRTSAARARSSSASPARCASAPGLDARPEWRAAIRNPLDLAGYLGAVENGLTFGALAGHERRRHARRQRRSHGNSVVPRRPRQRLRLRARAAGSAMRRCRTSGASSSWPAASTPTRRAACAIATTAPRW